MNELTTFGHKFDSCANVFITQLENQSVLCVEVWPSLFS